MISKDTLFKLTEIYTRSHLETGLLHLAKNFYLNQFFTIQQDPAIQEIVERVRQKKQLNKVDAAILSFSVFENEKVYKEFLQTLPAPLQKLIEKLLWVENLTDAQVEIFLNESILVPAQYRDHKDVQKQYYFFDLRKQSFYTFKGPNVIIDLSLPPLFKQVLMQFYPKPPHYYFIPLDELPGTWDRFNGEDLIMQEMPKLLSYYMQDNIKYSIKGKPTDATIKKLQRSFGLAEFFESDNEILGKTRTTMLAGLLHGLKIKDISINVLSILKELFSKQYTSLHTSQCILQQLKGWTYMDEYDYEDIAESNFLAVIKQLPPGKWVSADNLTDYVECNFVKINPIKSWGLNNRLYYEKKYSSYADKKYVSSNATNLVLHPFIKGTIFLFASFGLIEIAYKGVDTQELAITFNSAYDGLKYFRLTPLGAYVLGLSTSYEPAQVQQQNTLQFSEDSLLILAEGDLGVLDVMLGSFAEKAGSNRFRVSHAHFLKDCKTKKEIDKKIELFKKTISAKLPAYWEQQFKTWLENATKVAEDIQTKVYQIPADAKELQRLIAQDTVLKTLILKAEKFHILIPPGNVTRFKSRMKELGYLVE